MATRESKTANRVNKSTNIFSETGIKRFHKYSSAIEVDFKIPGITRFYGQTFAGQGWKKSPFASLSKVNNHEFSKSPHPLWS